MRRPSSQYLARSRILAQNTLACWPEGLRQKQLALIPSVPDRQKGIYIFTKNGLFGQAFLTDKVACLFAHTRESKSKRSWQTKMNLYLIKSPIVVERSWQTKLYAYLIKSQVVVNRSWQTNLHVCAFKSGSVRIKCSWQTKLNAYLTKAQTVKHSWRTSLHFYMLTPGSVRIKRSWQTKLAACLMKTQTVMVKHSWQTK